MKKRYLCLLLAAIMLISLAPAVSVTAEAATLSNGMSVSAGEAIYTPSNYGYVVSFTATGPNGVVASKSYPTSGTGSPQVGNLYLFTPTTGGTYSVSVTAGSYTNVVSGGQYIWRVTSKSTRTYTVYVSGGSGGGGGDSGGGGGNYSQSDCGDNLDWSLKYGTLRIFGYGTMYDFTYRVSAPWHAYRNEISAIVVENGVRNIGAYAFLDLNVSSIQIANSVTEIGECAFYDFSVGYLSLPSSVNTIDNEAFARSNIREIEINGNLYTVGRDLFYNSSAFTLVLNCSTVGTSFKSVEEMTKLILTENVTSVDSYAFEYCRGLRTVEVQNPYCRFSGMYDLFYNRDTQIICPCTASSYPEAAEEAGYTVVRRHNYKQSTVQPTCTKKGGTLKKCDFCGDSTFYATTDALGHDFGAWTQTTAPGCTKSGKETRRCSRCDETETRSVAPLGHNYVNGICSRCGGRKPTQNPFTDVSKKDYFYEPVMWAVYHDPQITAGTSKTKFSPNENCTRAQVVTFLWRAAGAPKPKNATNPFQDVKQKDYYYKAVLWAVENGITSGTGKTKFSPDEPCTRGQVVTFLWRSAGAPNPKTAKNPFQDVKQKDYCYKAVLWAVENGVTAGTGKTKFSPDDACTRGQIVTFLYRALGE